MTAKAAYMPLSAMCARAWTWSPPSATPTTTLQGDYAFVIARADEDCMYAFKKGSGLVAGIAERRHRHLI